MTLARELERLRNRLVCGNRGGFEQLSVGDERAIIAVYGIALWPVGGADMIEPVLSTIMAGGLQPSQILSKQKQLLHAASFPSAPDLA